MTASAPTPLPPDNVFVSATSGVIGASPNPASDGSTTITWNHANNGSTSQVWVSMNGGSEVLMAQEPSGSTTVSWIQSSSVYEFRLYAGEGHLTSGVLGSVTVTRG